jgi:hypothetical protein
MGSPLAVLMAARRCGRTQRHAAKRTSHGRLLDNLEHWAELGAFTSSPGVRLIMVRVLRIASSVLITLLLLVSVPLAKTETHADPDVVFNTQSLIYHRASCSSARRCTKNCVVVKLSEAKERGGRACRICGGPATSDHDFALTANPDPAHLDIGDELRTHWLSK